MITYLRQWAKNNAWKPVLPMELIFFVTGRCTFRCKHCCIEKFDSDSSRELSLETIKRLASDLPTLAVLMLTGGEPFMRNDLPELVHIFSVRSRPKVISIATNGFLTDKIVEMVGRILSLPEFSSQLVVTLSFEGIGQDHDNNRRFAGAYEKALSTAKCLKELQEHHSSLAVGANMTMIPGNEKTILSAARELAGKSLFSFLSQNVYRERRPFNACTQINLSVYRQLSRFVQAYSRSFKMSGNSLLGRWHYLKERFQANLIERTCRTNTYQGITCEAGRGIGVVYHDGRVGPCELLPADWGSVKERPFSQIWNSSTNRRLSDQLRLKRCFCSHECFISASVNLQLIPMLSCLSWNLFQTIQGSR
jgi:MoaA/NifB/PqqE/SkfB family radical SAM enzyme